MKAKEFRRTGAKPAREQDYRFDIGMVLITLAVIGLLAILLDL